MEPSSLATKQVAAFIGRMDSFLEAATIDLPHGYLSGGPTPAVISLIRFTCTWSFLLPIWQGIKDIQYCLFLRVESVQLKVYDCKRHSGLLLSASRDKTVKYWDTRR